MTAEPTAEIQVHRSVRVPLPPERAFELFTARMGEFWPREHSIGSSAIAEVIVEPWPGGRWYERGVDGTECDWGRVGEWQPPDTVVLLWQIGANWRFDPDLETEVEVTFTEESAGRTLVELRHRHLERYDGQADVMYAVFDSPGGWTGTLDRFAEAAG
ncbi:SRPBCC family protein [Amycolatopsis aidingensis]|uniref:SRPBCC family protein n=1 Tax=Amycolatopsis aidingensis TaxID=2842453 RepID=UPI001C0C2B5F|nr:SRPBCC family protein [Amycolatopsis aidingensis]